jgi:conjugative transfer signal peptidase TraF
MNLHRRPFRAILVLLGASAALCSLTSLVMSHLLVNQTESLPLGLYWLTRQSNPDRGDIVAFPVPPAIRELALERHYLPAGNVLLKPVVAVAGDRVCTRDDVAYVNDAPIGDVLAADSSGRPLPHDDLCGPVPPGHLYVASHHPRSFDSRTFGPVDAATVRGKATPLWTF